MVIYNPSSATTTVSVVSAEVETVLTITSSNPEPVQGEGFTLAGELTRADTGALLSGERISFTATDQDLNVTDLGETTTRDIGGTVRYEHVVQLLTTGEYVIRADFTGSERLGFTLRPTFKVAGVDIGASMTVPLVIGGITALGLILMAVSLK